MSDEPEGPSPEEPESAEAAADQPDSTDLPVPDDGWVVVCPTCGDVAAGHDQASSIAVAAGHADEHNGVSVTIALSCLACGPIGQVSSEAEIHDAVVAHRVAHEAMAVRYG